MNDLHSHSNPLKFLLKHISLSFCFFTKGLSNFLISLDLLCLKRTQKTLILLNCISILIISILNLLFSAPFDTPTCPYCRQRITMILLYFSETERNSAELDIIDRRSQIINSVRSYNRRFSGKKKIFFFIGIYQSKFI